MTSDRMRMLALVAFLTAVVYGLEGLRPAGAGGVASVWVIAAGLATAAWAPPLLRSLVAARGRARAASLEAFRRELAVQTSARGVAELLVARVRQLTGASAVSLYLGSECLASLPAPPETPPVASFPLVVRDAPIGELWCHGRLRRMRHVPLLLRFGALALENARLAEQTAAAERARGEAQAQRDLQYRLTWTVTTRLYELLAETRGRLEGVRQCARTLPADVLARDLDNLSERLRQLEGFVQDNLRNANSLQGPSSAQPLARFPRPR